MQVKGKTIVLTALAVALVMSGGAWWYHYRASRQAAQFWGPEATQLLIGKGDVAFLELAAEDEVEDSPATADGLAGMGVAKTHDLTDQPGLIHLRHALTQDVSFDWAGRQRKPLNGAGPWKYAMRFSDDGHHVVILWSADFERLGRHITDGGNVDVLPCPRLAPAVQAYLRDVGVL
jgi:hypothetical protein